MGSKFRFWIVLLVLFSKFYWPLCVYRICCRRACLVVAPWALLTALWTCAYLVGRSSQRLALIFLSLLQSIFDCSITCLVSWFWGCSDFTGIPFPSSMGQAFFNNNKKTGYHLRIVVFTCKKQKRSGIILCW